MKKLLIVLIAVLTVFTLASCKQEPAHEHVYNEYGLCLTCGDYKGLTMTRVSDNDFKIENVIFKEGKNYVRFTLQEDADEVNEFRCIPDKDAPSVIDHSKIEKLFIYDSVFLQTITPTPYINTLEIDGIDGHRTVYLVVECSGDCSFDLVQFFS